MAVISNSYTGRVKGWPGEDTEKTLSIDQTLDTSGRGSDLIIIISNAPASLKLKLLRSTPALVRLALGSKKRFGKFAS
jgi:hypothetical protein